MIYRTYFHNMIYDYTITPNVLSYQNIDHVIYTGVEVSVRWSISTQLLSSWSINLVDNRDMEDVLIPNTQPLSAHIRLSYLNPKGKLKGTINLPFNTNPSEIEKKALSLPKVMKIIGKKKPKKIIVVKNKIANIVI